MSKKFVDIATNVIFLAGEIAELEAPTQTALAVLPCCGEEQAQPVVHERVAVAARRTKIDQFNLARKEVSETFLSKRNYLLLTWRVSAFHRKLDQLGSVCISRKTKSSFRQSSITRAAIFVGTYVGQVEGGAGRRSAPRRGLPEEDDAPHPHRR